jgi:hypothetical protein
MLSSWRRVGGNEPNVLARASAIGRVRGFGRAEVSGCPVGFAYARSREPQAGALSFVVGLSVEQPA